MANERLTTTQAAEVLNKPRREVQRLIQVGRLKAEKVGRDYLLDPADVAAFQPQQRGRPKKEETR